MAARTVSCTLVNQTKDLLRREEHSLAHGIWSPDGQAPALGTSVLTWNSESSGIMTGTEGTAVYRGDNGSVTLHWNNPYVGKTRADGSSTGDYNVEAKVDGDKAAIVQFVVTSRTAEPAPTPTESAAPAPAPPVASSDGVQSEGTQKGTAGTSGNATLASSTKPVPVLSQALRVAPAGQKSKFWTKLDEECGKGKTINPTTETELGKLLTHIQERLTKGLGEAWMAPVSQFGYGGEPTDTPEENWARGVSEALVYSAYGGTSVAYHRYGSKIGEADMAFYRRMSFQSEGKEDPVFGIVLACQHIATLMITTRGFPLSDLSDIGLACSGTIRDFPLFKNGSPDDKKNGPPDDKKSPKPGPRGGRWIGGSTATTTTTTKDGKTITTTTNSENTAARDIKWLINEQNITPGSMFTFNAGGPDTTSQNPGPVHIGGVLRVANGGLQTFDTGVLAPMSKDGEGTGDHTLLAGSETPLPEGTPAPRTFSVPGLEGRMVGIGIAPLVTPSPDDIAMLKKARPLGYARLFVTRIDAPKDEEFVQFYSRLLPMWWDDNNFPVTRYYWSLRNLHVNRATTGVFWVLCCSSNKHITKALLAPGSRGKSHKQTLDEALQAAGTSPDERPMKRLHQNCSVTHVLRAVRPPSAPSDLDSDQPPALYRHHLDRKQNWVGGKDGTPDTTFPPQLDNVRFFDDQKQSFANRWALLEVNECQWWDGSKYVAASDALSDAPYFKLAGA